MAKDDVPGDGHSSVQSSPHSSSPVSTPARDDRDLYCLDCGYNLRGLSGDPRRCPECGHMNPIGDMELPAELITRQLRRMETAPAVCVGMVLLFLFMMGMIGSILYISDGKIASRDEINLLICWCVFSMIGAVVWIVNVRIFRRSCLKKPGWTYILWRYHLYGAGAALLVLAGFIVWVLFCMSDLGDGSRWSPILKNRILLPLTWMIVIVAVIKHLGPKFHLRAKQNMETLRRELAVIIASETLRKSLWRKRRF